MQLNPIEGHIKSFKQALTTPASYNITVCTLSFGCKKLTKMALGAERLSNLVAAGNPLNIDALNLIMQDTTQAQDQNLPDPGVTLDVEKWVSSIFIRGKSYGTRTTSYVFFSRKNIQVYEFNYNRSGRRPEIGEFTIPLDHSTLEVSQLLIS